MAKIRPASRIGKSYTRIPVVGRMGAAIKRRIGRPAKTKLGYGYKSGV